MLSCLNLHVYRLCCWLYGKEQMVMFSFYWSFPFFSLHHTVSFFLFLYSEPQFISKPHTHSSLLLYCWKQLVIYLWQGVFPKGKRYAELLTITPEVNRCWHVIFASYYLQNCRSQFLWAHIHFLRFSPSRSNERVRNHRINWANGLDLPKWLWWNKWEKEDLSVLIYHLFWVVFSL